MRSTAPCHTGDSRRATCSAISTAADTTAARPRSASSRARGTARVSSTPRSPAAGPTTASRTRSASVTRASARHIPRRSCPAGARTSPSISSDTASAAQRRGCSCSCSRTAAPRRCRRPRPRVRRPRRCSPAAGPAGCTRWWPSPHRTTGRRFPTCSRMLRMRSRRCFSARRARSASRHSRTYMTSGSTSSASAATRTSQSRRPRCGCWRKTRSRRATTPLTTCAAPVRARSMRASPRCRTPGISPSPAAGRCRVCSRTTRSPTRP